MIGKYMKVYVNNAMATGKYVVARYDDHSHSLWYYGSYDSEERAKEVAEEIGNGLVVENDT